VLGIEDVASYSDYFSPKEWDAIQTGDWSQAPQEDWNDSFKTQQVSSGVTVYGPECAAQRDQVAPEDQSEARSNEARSNEAHSVAVVASGESDEDSYELECGYCGYLGAADDVEEAQAISHLHEQFVAVLLERWDAS
jgi:hypothetical protein